ncbi:MAG: 30S ribosomal protein S2, partial [Microbacteriaceae bacterium]|nr:30S ribosomal protein S2 [Microbacteriaceae bacterium]
MAVVTTRQLLDSGVHFGHQTKRWNPKMKKYILTDRSGIYIIDLQQSLEHIDAAYNYVKDVVAKGGNILFVGTKKQAQEIISQQALRVGQPYINERWLGGLLTNFNTVNKRLQRLKELEIMDLENTASTGYTKKELLLMRRERDKLNRSLGGIKNITRTPSAIWVVDTNKEHLAVTEAKKLGIPVIAILDTNCDPDDVKIGIPGNDDAIRSIELLTKVIADAAADGMVARHSSDEQEAEPLAEWERELLAQQDAASNEQVVEESETAHSSETEAPAAKEAPAKKTEEKPAAKKPAASKSADKSEDKPAAKKPAAKTAEK